LLHRGQGRPQLVRHHRKEVRLHVVKVFQAVAHEIESSRELGDLRRRGKVDLAVELAARDQARPLFKNRKRLGDAARNYERYRDNQDEGRGGDEDGDAVRVVAGGGQAGQLPLAALLPPHFELFEIADDAVNRVLLLVAVSLFGIRLPRLDEFHLFGDELAVSLMLRADRVEQRLSSDIGDSAGVVEQAHEILLIQQKLFVERVILDDKKFLFVTDFRQHGLGQLIAQIENPSVALEHRARDVLNAAEL